MTSPAYIYWDPDLVLFRLGPFGPRWYGLLFAIAFLLGYRIVLWIFRRESKPAADLNRLFFARVDMLPRHPAQLYEATAYGIVFLFLLGVYRISAQRASHGLLLGLFLILVFTARFFVEFVKVKQEGYDLDLLLSPGQWLSVPFIAAGLLLVVRVSMRQRRRAEAKLEDASKDG